MADNRIRGDNRQARRRRGSDRATINKILLLFLIVLAVATVFLVDKMQFRFRTVDPRLWIGVETVELTPGILRQYDIQSANGLLVSRVFVGSPADIACVKEGDVIRRWNGASVTNQGQLKYFIQTADVGKKVTITVDRSNESVLLYCEAAIRPGGV